MPYLSIVIPVYNEAKRLPQTIQTITEYLKKKHFSSEIILVDDGSSDGSTEHVQQSDRIRVLRHVKNQGKGAAVRTGMLAARGELVLFSDADLSTPIDELDVFLKHIKKYAVVIGSRSIKGARVEQYQPLYRVLIGKVFNKFVRLITIRGIIDTQCGFKLFTRQAAQDVFKRQTMKGFSFDVEVLYIARRHGYAILEHPVRWKNAPGSKVSPLKDSIRMLRDLVIIRLNDLRGLYK